MFLRLFIYNSREDNWSRQFPKTPYSTKFRINTRDFKKYIYISSTIINITNTRALQDLVYLKRFFIKDDRFEKTAHQETATKNIPHTVTSHRALSPPRSISTAGTRVLVATCRLDTPR